MATTINDLPDAILSNIIALISDSRTRNSISLVSHKFLQLERPTRTTIVLRGNARDLFMIPRCFRSVTHLDLSLLSPWGHSLLSSSSSSYDPHLLAHRLRQAFPSVTSLTVYARSPSVLQVLLSPQWPALRHLKLVRWHQRPHLPVGSDFSPVFDKCPSLSTLDLSEFYYWSEDLPPVLRDYPAISASLTKLDLLTTSFAEGFKSLEIQDIAAACPNLKHLLLACVFDPRYNGFVGDEALLSISRNCPKLTLLHLADTTSLSNTRGDPNEDGYSSEDARISRATLVDLFSCLPLLEELVLDVCKNVRDSGLALEALGSNRSKLKVLKLGQFHGVCMAIGSQLDGIALCRGLESLSIKNSADLDDMGLIEIARGCGKLTKFEVVGCKKITGKGLRTLASLLRKTLVEVGISACINLDAAASLKALEPVRDRIERLHIDCVWENLGEEDLGGIEEDTQEGVYDFNIHEVDEEEFENGRDEMDGMGNRKKCKYSSEASAKADCSYMASNGNGFWFKTWERLRYLSLWIGVGELLTPLPMAGLEDCPNLEEIRIKVEGDCRGRHKPAELAFGLSTLARYNQLSKMQLDCGDTLGFALTAPSGQMDLSLWERFFLNGIGDLMSLEELDYWPPQDRDVNQRSLTLPGAGLLGGCFALRKLFIHGTAHEHFLTFLLRIPNLRDVQLREDYYPAPENDMSTEMRVDSCSRFEDALNSRPILD
ncbi:hypothetical protein F2P56_002199 [Juglans regia]|uniref:F-box protein MAX2 n=2 Tax=Juglans regia TaxID=51240 RepID=A0A2I4EDJ9_JUGRE|nr:F-box protein MAX2 [Juglans regia]KAF5481558.1 hypothetical protein F2P56_002199 [Juglans regia]